MPVPTLSPPRQIALVFFIQPLTYGAWLPRIPEVRDTLGVGPAELAMALLGAPIGTLLTLTFSGALVARIGARAAILYGFLLFLAVVCLQGFATSAPLLFAALALTGAAMSVLELGLNVAADGIEARAGRLIMSTCHGFWSLGLMAGSLIGAACAALALPPGPALLALAALLLAPSLLAAAGLPRDAGAPGPQPSVFFRPGRELVGACAFVFGITLTEGAAADWSAVLMRDAFGLSTGGAALAFAPFAATVAAGRFAGDRLKARHGPVATARAGCMAALAGAVLLAASSLPALAVAGLALLGLGVSFGFPLAVSAVAGIGDRPPAANVAFLSLVALTGFLVGPSVIGAIAQHLGIQAGLAAVIPPLLLSLARVGALGGRRAAPAAERDAYVLR